jgi:hypothetical protein
MEVQVIAAGKVVLLVLPLSIVNKQRPDISRHDDVVLD